MSITQVLLGTAIVFANDLKAAFNAHINDAVIHTGPNAPDTVHLVKNADATDLFSLKNLTNELMLNYAAHQTDAALVSPFFHKSQEGSDQSLESVALVETIEEIKTRLEDIQLKYNAHDADPAAHLLVPDGAIFYCDFEDDTITADLSGGDPNHTVRLGSPTIESKQPSNQALPSKMLNTSGGPASASRVTWPGFNAAPINVGGLSFRFTSDFNGHQNGFGVEQVFGIATFGFNQPDTKMQIIHDATAGNKLILNVAHSGVADFGIGFNITPGAFSFTQNFEEYFELYWTDQGGAGNFLVYSFLNGILQNGGAVMDTGAIGTRVNDAVLTIEPSYLDGWFDDIVLYSSVQHTTDHPIPPKTSLKPHQSNSDLIISSIEVIKYFDLAKNLHPRGKIWQF